MKPFLCQQFIHHFTKIWDSISCNVPYTCPFLRLCHLSGVESLEYRLVFDSLWSVDPHNPRRNFSVRPGIEHSVAPLPPQPPLPKSAEPFDGIVFSFRGRPVASASPWRVTLTPGTRSCTS
jgi:hypothetical protein